jgi:ASPIC and UnbV/Domain of unknown function (DUF6851)/FG-GAP-like repeat/VCPO second helical-bundle domain
VRVARALAAGAILAIAVILAACGSGEQADEPSALAEPRKPGDTRLVDISDEVGLDFRQGAFRWDTAPDVVAMQGTGLCWLDYDGDGLLDLFVVNSYAVVEAARWRREGGLPETALYKNEGGRFEDVSEDAGANFAIRGTGCVAADLDTDGDTDLYVTTATEQLLLWNDGDGRFSEGARDAGVAAFGWHSGAAVGDVNGDGRPDLVVAGYADPLNPVPDAPGGFPATVLGVRDLLFLNEGPGDDGETTFREVGEDAGLEVVKFAHGLGVVLTDVDVDGDLDIYLSNDTEPDRLYKNVAWPGGEQADPAGLGFRFEEVAAQAGVADPGAGMGVASGDYDGDVLPDLFVTNLRGQGHGVFRTGDAELPPPSFTDERLVFGPDLFAGSGWGVSWADLDLDTDLDVVLVNGHVPLTNLAEDAQVPEAFENGTAQGKVAHFTDASERMGIADVGKLNARGSAAADYDSDGDLDVAIAVVGGPLLLLENRGEGGRWLELELDTFAPGTRVTVTLPGGRRLVREVQSGSSYASSEDPRLHFGLGAAEQVDSVEVRWPGGSETRLHDVEANQLLRLEPPEHEPVADAAAEDYVLPGCERDRADRRSAARVWDEALLDAIRRDVPAPTVHARNLFHVSAAMWDAWAAYEPGADGVFIDEKQEADDVQAAREAAISYAAYRLLLHRYAIAAGLEETFTELASTMKSLCYDISYLSTEGDSPAALGNRIAAAAIERGRDDGSLEETRYVDTDYKPVNPPLIVAESGADMRDPDRWQPLALAHLVAQNGLPIPGKVQTFVGPHWGHVASFALLASAEGLPIDPGPPPHLGTRVDEAYKQTALDLIRRSSQLDPADGVMVDIGPGALGDNSLGTMDGNGHDENPATGKPYPPDRVLRADYARSLAEFWADGPKSETPPGHWNTVANAVSDSAGFVRRIGGRGTAVSRLEWDVKLYLALNGAVHDAAIAAWGVKGFYDSVRPISMIRYMGGRGQSSDPDGPAYDPRGLPLESGLVEVITAESSARGKRHAHLADHRGEIAIKTWRGNPEDPETQKGGVGWILAADWLPYQLPTFVTPAFAGYVSGHSTFSRAAAEVLKAFTGDPFFPGGVYEWPVHAGDLKTEAGPAKPLELQWATYFDAADQAGISRLFMGIHISPDDFEGRKIGARAGRQAWSLAQRYFDGSAR